MYIILIVIIILIMIFLTLKNLEKFQTIGVGTRVCNNRGCDLRITQKCNCKKN